MPSPVIPLTGLDQVLFAMSAFENRDVKRVMNSAVRAGAAVGVKAVKATIAQRYPSVRKAISSRMLKKSEMHVTEISGSKLGGGVGKKTKKLKRVGKKGEGISKNDIHWWFLGTLDRWTGSKAVRRGAKHGGHVVAVVRTGKKRKFTGRMPVKAPPVVVTLQAARSAMMAAITAKGRSKMAQIAPRAGR